MFLKSIEMFGFKSFPERTKMEYKNGVTVVVGPNGCGKSNISDAVRWVFGERSTKALRSKKMEDVIFSGSAGRVAAGYAEVSLTLDNTARELDVEDDEVCVTRRIYRSGETEYMINKKSVRLADLLEIFMDTGLGRDGYSLIGQGRIAEIISAKSEERREIFEEAAGISKHRFRKEEAQRNLARAGENLVRINDIMSELEGRVEPLRLAAEKADRYLELSNEKRGLELGVWLYNLDKSENTIKDLTQKIDAAKALENDSNIKIGNIQNEIDAIYKSSQSYNVYIEQKRQQVESLRLKQAEITAKTDQLKSGGAYRGSDAERIRGEIEQLRLQNQRDAETAESCRARIAEKEDECRTLETQISELESELAGLNAGEGGKQQRYEQLFSEIEEAARAVNDAKIETVQRSAALEQAERDAERARADLERLSELLTDIKDEKELTQNDLAQINEDISKRTNSHQGLLLRAENTGNKLNALKEEISQLTATCEACRHKARTLEDMEKQMDGYAGSVKSVLGRGASGGLRGILGTVAQLASVPDRFAVAIETALGGAVQNIVVETQEQAKYAISYLKNENLGRATFLPIDAVKGDELQEKEYAAFEGYQGVASRLISYDGRFSGIFKRLLGYTLVFDDMDNALAAAKKTGNKNRIVTLDGQVINAGGSMSGGSINKSSGTISRVSQLNEYKRRADELQKQIESKTAQVADLQKELAACEAQLATQTATLKGLGEEKVRSETCLAQIERNLTQTQKETDDAREYLNSYEKNTEPLKAALLQLETDIARSQAVLEQKNAESRLLAEDRNEFFEKREALLGDISQKRLAVAETRKDIGALTQSAAAAAADTAARETSIKEQLDRLEMFKVMDSEDDAAIDELRAEAGQVEAEIEKYLHDISQSGAERDQFDLRINSAREKEKEIMETLQRLAGENARLLERRENAGREFDGTVARLWDEYELTREEAKEKANTIENPAEAARTLSKLREKIRAMGSVNTGAREEYTEVSTRYNEMKTQHDDVIKSQSELEKLIASLDEKMTQMFSDTFVKINEKFKEVFVQLFGGGSADLSLENPDDMLNCGIEIKAQPPGKAIKNLESLSGGEQSLLAIAIFFAILKVKPTPFCLMDEIEAALDEVNVNRFADYLTRMSGDTQFIVITHRRGTMEIADTLYGVTMKQGGESSGVSKILQLDISEVESKLGIKV